MSNSRLAQIAVTRNNRISRKSAITPMMEAVEERRLMATFAVTTVADSGTGSLRDALTKANKSSDTDLIQFKIGSGAKTIQPTSALPFIKYAVTLDGTTQSGYAGKPLIEIRGDKTSGDGIRVGGGNSTVKGLIINRFSGNGMILVNKGGNTITGNWIGLDKTGTVAAKNGAKGIVVSTSANKIEKNVISGNGSSGLQFWSAASYGNFAYGNYIGTDYTGEKSVGNISTGIAINASASNTIGGTADTQRNVISGNKSNGIVVNKSGSRNNKIVGNYIGTNKTGDKALGNVAYGVEISQPNNTVQNNVISGNGKTGLVLWLSTASGTKVTGNYIGTDKTGKIAIANLWRGIEVTNGAKDNIIGGTGIGERNIISGNKQNGVSVYQGSNNKFFNNYVGVDVTGTKKLANGGDGFRLVQTNTTLISGGIIGYNTGYGVHNGASKLTVVTGVKLIDDPLFLIKMT